METEIGMDDLITIIGEQTVNIRLLKQEKQELTNTVGKLMNEKAELEEILQTSNAEERRTREPVS